MRRIGRAVVEGLAGGMYGCLGIVFLFFLIMLVFALPTIWHSNHFLGVLIFTAVIVPFIKGFIKG